MAWAVPKHSREDLNRASKILLREMRAPDLPYSDTKRWADWSWALDVINNWRAAHAYPLNTFQVNLRRSARSVDTTALVAQRTKRLVSISQKLDRFPNMKLSQMQDIGGAVAELVGIEGGVVSGVINLESSGVEASDWRLRHDQAYHEA